ncbi:MAG: MASE3 domain-containing protein [Armatimonadota bacterium]
MPTSNSSQAQSHDMHIIGLKYLWVTILCFIIMVIAGLFRSQQPFVSVSYYLPLHLALELSSIVVSFAVSATAWYGFHKTKTTREMVVSVTFMAAGIIDFIHALSFKGMPDFFTVNDTGTAAAYWLAARLIIGIGVIAAIYLHGHVKHRRLPQLLILSMIIIITTLVVVMTKNEPYSGLAFFNGETGGLTILKISLEYVIIGIYLWAFFALSASRDWDLRLVILLRYALILAIFSELAFTLYLSPYGYFNAIGHLFKTVSYYLVFNALFTFTISRPYEELTKANIELQSLYNQSEEQRREIHASVARIGSALSSSLNLDQALKQIADLISDIFRCGCTIVITGKHHHGGIRTMAYSASNPGVLLNSEQTLRLCRNAITNLEPEVINNSAFTELNIVDYECEEDARCFVCVPMILAARVLGVITLYTPDKDFLNDDDINLIKALASHAAVAVHNAISYELESRVAFVLQNAILDSSNVTTENLDIVHAYKPAVDGTLVGGDFYDIIDLHDGRIAFAIGDVSGKGIEAAVYAAMAKYSLRAHLQTCQSPVELIRLLDTTIADQTNAAIFITMFFGILDTRTGELEYVNAGHNPPIYNHDDRYDTLEPTGTILGANISQDYSSNRIMIENGGLLVIYTDGISEARHSKEMFNTEGIIGKMQELQNQDTQTIVSGILKAAIDFADGEQKDDVAIMALKFKK